MNISIGNLKSLKARAVWVALLFIDGDQLIGRGHGSPSLAVSISSTDSEIMTRLVNCAHHILKVRPMIKNDCDVVSSDRAGTGSVSAGKSHCSNNTRYTSFCLLNFYSLAPTGAPYITRYHINCSRLYKIVQDFPTWLNMT